ncbi:unnamed protein product [Lactuca saligna]|uniref:Uncharacterized protein n=1 Tax=Lactuca saligna TaxID=75948 RepID=A0AA35Z9L5_LACSI|nr:unnamed protein product [Lactuca saligna]
MRLEIKVFAITAAFIFLFMSVEPNRACRLLNREFEETWMKTGNLLLSSLQKGTVRPPGNGCCNTGGCGNPCVGSRKVVGHLHSGGPPPPSLTPYPTSTPTSTDQ